MDLAWSRAADRKRQAEHRDRRQDMRASPAPSVRMSRTRSDAEAVEIVEEIQKKLARLAQLSRARSTPQAMNSTRESGEFCG
jgi:hypothetical protein